MKKGKSSGLRKRINKIGSLTDHVLLRLSDDHLKAIIWVMRECKTPDVPAFSALRKKQASITSDVGIKSEHHTSSLGNHFYMNHPAKLLALDWANPLVRPFIHIYPEVSGPIAEFWQADKWTSEIGLDELSPMWADWENKAASHPRQYDGTYVVPGDLFEVGTGSYSRIAAKTLALNYLDLRAALRPINFTEYSPHYEMPHPLREKARGRPMFRLRVMPWSDDVSGKVSKQYNAHTNMYVTNLNLPHQKLAQEYFVRFASTSPHASSSELFVALGDDFIPGTWHDAYDCELEEAILFEIIPHVLPADNPQQSETASHIGMAGNLGCRKDLNGGPKAYQETDEGYEAFYNVRIFFYLRPKNSAFNLLQPGEPRDKEVTVQTIRWQVWKACGGNKTVLDASYSQTGIKDKISQYWIQRTLEMGKGFRAIQITDPQTRDPRVNTLKGEDRKIVKDEISRQIQLDLWNWVIQQPPESYALLSADDPEPFISLIHAVNLILLQLRDWTCVPEYISTFYYALGFQWDTKKEEIFAARLAASSISGLSIPPPRPRYVVQYKNSLIGKHFKMLQQLGVFHIHDLCTPLLFSLWKATGELGAHLWYPEINNMEQYLADLKVLVANLLDIWGLIDPERILVKGKLHVSRICQKTFLDLVRPSCMPEIYECFNAVFRLCSIFSNHLAPSRDIAATLADMERFKHVASGAWWKNSEGTYIRAGSLVRSFLTSNRELQRRLGWSETRPLVCGTVKPESSAKRGSNSWEKALGSTFGLTEPAPTGASWASCKSVTTQSGDSCKPGSWMQTPEVGRISKILARDRNGKISTQSSNAIVVVDLFVVLDTKDQRLNMPILIQSSGTQTSLVKPRCSTAAVPVLQERIVTDRTELHTRHSSQPRFILNMHGLHNAHRIRDVLPRALTAPKPYLQDRIASHSRFAEQLRTTGPAKRAATRAKTQATRARNKQQKMASASAQEKRQGQSSRRERGGSHRS
ncbi:hypothetical protein B0H14DRAFT_3134513 [Mycena olivaceomarginata]|nr:hypothetical protein B0H14DRAFT_3134513 [Mycena olivaceomarginata]